MPPCPDNIDFRSQTEYIPGKTCKIVPQPVELPPKEKWRLTATPDQIRLVDSARENGNIPSLNTQSRIKGLLVVRDFCFWALWAARPLLKKRVWADYEQLLRVFFSCFRGQQILEFFFEYCSVRTKKLHKMK